MHKACVLYQCADQTGGTQPGDSLAEGEEEAVHLEIFEFVKKLWDKDKLCQAQMYN